MYEYNYFLCTLRFAFTQLVKGNKLILMFHDATTKVTIAHDIIEKYSH